MKIPRNICFGCIGIALLLSAGCMNIWSAAEITEKDTPEIAAEKVEVAKYIAEVERLKGQLEAERLTAELRLEMEREEFRMRLRAAEEKLRQEIFPARYFYFAGLGAILLCGLAGIVPFLRSKMGGFIWDGLLLGGVLIGVGLLGQTYPWAFMLLLAPVIPFGIHALCERIKAGRAMQQAQTATEVVQIIARGIETAPEEAGKAVKARIKNNPAAAAKIEPLIRPALEGIK